MEKNVVSVRNEDVEDVAEHVLPEKEKNASNEIDCAADPGRLKRKSLTEDLSGETNVPIERPLQIEKELTSAGLSNPSETNETTLAEGISGLSFAGTKTDVPSGQETLHLVKSAFSDNVVEEDKEKSKDNNSDHTNEDNDAAKVDDGESTENFEENLVEVFPSTLSHPGRLEKWSRDKIANKWILEEACADKDFLADYDLNNIWMCDRAFAMLTEKDEPDVFCRRVYDWTYFDATLTFVGPDENPQEYSEDKYIVLRKGTKLHLKYTTDSLLLLGWATPPRGTNSACPKAVTYVMKGQRPLRDRTPTKKRAQEPVKKAHVSDVMRLVDPNDVDWCKTDTVRREPPLLNNRAMDWFRQYVLKETGPDEINGEMGQLPKGCLKSISNLQLKWTRRNTGPSFIDADLYRSADKRLEELREAQARETERRRKLLAEKKKEKAAAEKNKRKSLKQGDDLTDVPTDRHGLGSGAPVQLNQTGERTIIVTDGPSGGAKSPPRRVRRALMTEEELAAFDAKAKIKERERKRRYRERQKLQKAQGDDSGSHFLDEGRPAEEDTASAPAPKRPKVSRGPPSSHGDSEDLGSSTGGAYAPITNAQPTTFVSIDQFRAPVPSNVPPAWVDSYFSPLFRTIAASMSQFNIAPLANVIKEISDTNKTLLSEMSQQIKQSNESLASRLASQERLMQEQGRMLKKMTKKKAFTVDEYIQFSQQLKSTQDSGQGTRPHLATEAEGVQGVSVPRPALLMRQPVDNPESAAHMPSSVPIPLEKPTKTRASTKSAEASATEESYDDEDTSSSAEETEDVLSSPVPMRLSKAETSKGKKKRDKSKHSKRSKASR